MGPILRLFTALIAVYGIMAAAPSARVMADDPDFLSASVGWFDINRTRDEGAEFRLEYRSDYKFLFLKPFVAGGGATGGHGFIGAGVLTDIFWGKRIVTTLSFAPHFYFGGNDKLDLDYPLEFRSQFELAYRFDNRSRLGLAFSHYSNADLGDDNPGTETFSLYYSLPFSMITGMFK